jgi:hypothetical protein
MSRFRISRTVAVAIVAVTSISCKTLPFPDPHLEGVYGQNLKKWTRTVALYSGLETRAFVRLTYLSPQFIEVQARQLSEMHAELPDQAAATLQRLRDENGKPTFFAVVYIPDKTANDWQHKDSIWRLALNLGLGEQPPLKVARYEVPFSAELRALYPYLDDYSVAYRIQFDAPAPPPGAPGAPPVTFTFNEVTTKISSALGHMVFHWRLDGGPEEPSLGVPPGEQEKHQTPKAD